MKYRISGLVIFLLIALNIQAQYSTMSGYVKDAQTGEVLIGGTVSIEELPEATVLTNRYGFYSLKIPNGSYFITAHYIGYLPARIKLQADKNNQLNFELVPKKDALREVVVKSNITKYSALKSTQMGVEQLNIKDLRSIPVLFGEKDILKTIQLLPGIKGVGEGSSGFYVRGGGADQNLILLDEATVYNPSHLLGFFSVFNSDAIKDVTVFKGEMPAEYGGRLSSVVDVKMDDGNTKKMNYNAGIGLISSRAMVQGPLFNHKGAFIVSARRTYADLFAKLSKDSNVNQAVLYFYDINLKASYTFNQQNKIFFSGYFGRDVLGFSNRFGFNWGNTTATLRWNHLFNEKLFSNTSLIFSNYNYVINVGSGTSGLNITSSIQDLNLKQDFQYYINQKTNLKFGLNVIYHTILPGQVTSTDAATAQSNTSGLVKNKYGLETALFASFDQKINRKWSFIYGLRLSSFSVLGPYDYVRYNSIGTAIDSVSYPSNKVIKSYINLEPRLAAKYNLTSSAVLKAAYGRNVQNMHLLSNSTSNNPTDLWVPSSLNIKPEIADQFSIGFFKNLKEDMYEFSIETYYKALQNQIDYRDGAQITLNQQVEGQLLYGRGRAYGVELTVKKKLGNLHGWVGYTLAKSEKQIDGINYNQYYPATQDRTHEISIVGIYDLSPKWTFSATWIYYTGNAVTFPSGKYAVGNNVINYYTERNGYRMPNYHRLDLSATWYRKKTPKFESSWTFSIYNAYNRENAYSIEFQKDPNDPSRTQAVQTTLFKIIPSISYNLKFY